MNAIKLNKQKPVNAGFCFMLAILILLLSVSCDENNSIVSQTPDPDPTDTTDITSDVIILTEDEVADFDKYYKPNEFNNMDMLRSDSKWSFVRSEQSEHFFVFWEEGFGDDPNSSEVDQALRVDIDDLLEKAEQFFNVNINILKFADLGNSITNLDKYKMQIYLHYTTDWMAYGGGYDDVIGALWVNPSTCKPVGSTIAHEIGHSFQYQTYADLLSYGGITNDFTRGFRYGFGGDGSNAFWEQCAQWQSFQSYPMEAFTSYNFSVYMDNYHRHFCHEWHRYASYWLHYYWAEKRGIETIAKLWREAASPEDPLAAYMRIYSLSVSDLNAELYEAATKMVTWDIDAIRSNGENFIGQFKYKFYQLDDGSYQVAYSNCPGTTGYNVIPLNVPEAGTVITTSFTAITPGSALASDDPGSYSDDGTTLTTTTYNESSLTRAGWRYGYVALLENGTRIYGDMNRKTSADVEFTVPEGCSRLWFVVLGAPSTYESHPWDEIESNDDQWPYKVKFSQTDLLGSVTVDPNQDPESITLTYDVDFPADGVNYTGTTVNLNTNGDISKVAQALSMQPSTIASNMLDAKSSPSEGKIAFAAVEPDGSLTYETTANGYGFWFDSSGAVIGWGSDNDSKIFSEFDVSNMQFSIGQYPGKSSAGDTYTVKEAFVYTKDGTEYTITFVFNITIQ